MSRNLAPNAKSADIRFLTIVSTLTRGGTERAAVNYTLGYHAHGMPRAVLAYNGGGPRKAALDEKGIPVFVGGDPAARNQAMEQARAWAPDILHLHRPGLPDKESAAILASLSHSRLRVFETNVFGYVDDTDDRLLFDLHLLLSRWCLKKWSDGSSDLKNGAPGVVIPYAVESSAFRPCSPSQKAAFRAELGIPIDATLFGRVGQPHWSKWSPILIESFGAIAEKFANAHLMVVGLPDGLKPHLERLPAHVRSRVHQPPMVNTDTELMRYYGAMDVFAHAAEKGESFGMVLCEAMLCGLPVITLSTPLRDNSQIEVIRNGETGIVVSDQRGFTAAMAALCSSSALREKMSNCGPASAKANYDISVIAESLIELARVALAADSSGDLAARVARDSRFIAAAEPEAYRNILKAAGITPSVADSVLLSAVNRPLTRRTILLVRSAQQRIRSLRG
jgi:glycosyltransferase involved in cell wall biosynthesis